MFGAIAESMSAPARSTEFEQGLRRFSLFLVTVTASLTVFIFAANTILGRGLFEALLFSLAIAVGLTPQLLPAIVTVSLSTGGRRLAERKVIVRHLVAIEDLGNLEVLFSDKTGTLTEGAISLEQVVGAGNDPSSLLAWASTWIAPGAQDRSGNPLDAALAADSRILDTARAQPGWSIREELSFSYERRDAAVMVESRDGERWVVVKGAGEEVLLRCTAAERGKRTGMPRIPPLDSLIQRGERVLAVAIHKDDGRTIAEQVTGLPELVGFPGFSDPPKADARAAIVELKTLGVEVKVLTGDHPASAQHVRAVGARSTGSDDGREA
jgi:Mg2+-importing ATPase